MPIATFTHFAFTGSTIIRALRYPWNRREMRAYANDIYISRPFLCSRTSVRHIPEYDTWTDPISWSDPDCTFLHIRYVVALFDDRTHARDVYFASNCERIVASVARSQYLVNVFDWTLCHMARPSQRVVVVLYCVVLCAVSFVSPLVPFRFPRRCNVKIFLKRRWESDKSKPRSSLYSLRSSFISGTLVGLLCNKLNISNAVWTK